MKKIALTFAIVLGISLCSYAQGGGLFGYGEASETEESYNIAWYSFYQDQEIDNGLFGLLRGGGMPGLPGHGSENNEPAPLGSGMAVLVGLGAAYLVAKKRKK